MRLPIAVPKATGTQGSVIDSQGKSQIIPQNTGLWGFLGSYCESL